MSAYERYAHTTNLRIGFIGAGGIFTEAVVVVDERGPLKPRNLAIM